MNELDPGILLGLTRLGRERLSLEVEQRGLAIPEGTTLRRLKVADLTELLGSSLSPADLGRLAAEGLARQRTHSIGGPTWLAEQKTLNAGLVRDTLPAFIRALSNEWLEVSADLIQSDQPGLLADMIELEYTSLTPQPIRNAIEYATQINNASILLDYEDGASTVSARSDRDALVIGTRWASALGGPLQPVALDFEPCITLPPYSPEAVRLLEAVYGRVGRTAIIVNVDRVWTRRQDPGARVRDQSAKGEDNHVLFDEDVKRCLGRGDILTGISFQLEWRYDPSGKREPFFSHVTLTSEDGPLFIRVTRGGQPLERVAALYQMIRKALASPTTKAGTATLETELNRILKPEED